MLQRGLSIALLFGYVASQMAAVPHAHPSDPLHRSHSSAPHLQLSWFDDVHHDHTHDHAHHHDNRYISAQDHAASPVGTGFTSSSARNHEADAIYLPTGVAARQSADARHPNLANDKARLTSDDGCLTDFHIRHWTFVIRHSPPKLSVMHCALYLQLRTLRV